MAGRRPGVAAGKDRQAPFSLPLGSGVAAGRRRARGNMFSRLQYWTAWPASCRASPKHQPPTMPFWRGGSITYFLACNSCVRRRSNLRLWRDSEKNPKKILWISSSKRIGSYCFCMGVEHAPGEWREAIREAKEKATDLKP